jgi:lysophospholipase L1-like esterase
MKNNIKYYTLALLSLLIFAPTFASAATPSRPSTQDIAVYLIGDSTVDFYPASRYPLTGWGMPFGDSFQPNVRVLNHAESGRSTRTFISDGRS